MEITPELKEKLSLLHEKYAALGEDFNAYLEGLLYADVTTYWDYIQLDTLLSLQKPKTSFPDEVIFIMYHQITELYFKLALREFEALGALAKPTKQSNIPMSDAFFCKIEMNRSSICSLSFQF